MKKLTIGLLIASAASAHSTELTTCRDPAGWAYFHFNGLIEKRDAGWQSDKISGGALTLVQNADLSFDVLYVDFRKKPISSVQDGAIVRLLRQSADTLTVLVHYSGSTEIYSFFREKDGQNRFTMIQSKTAGAIVPKSAVMLGTCEPIRFDLVRGH